MARTEWAILNKSGEIINVAATHLNHAEMLEHVRETFVNGKDYTVQPLYTCPMDVLERYQFWNERP